MLYGASFVLECENATIAPQVWKSLFETIGVESEVFLHLAKVSRPKIPSRVELHSWSAWRGHVNQETESLTVGTQSRADVTFSLQLGDRSSFGAVVVTDIEGDALRECLSQRNWNAAVCELGSTSSQTLEMHDYESALDGLALARFGFLCIVSKVHNGNFDLDFRLWTESGLMPLSHAESCSQAGILEEIAGVQRRIENFALAGLATSTLPRTEYDQSGQ